MGVPLVVKAPGITTPGTATDALATHVDLAATLCALGGVDLDETPSLSGVDLTPALADPSASPRDYVFFSQDSAQSSLIRSCRYAVRGFFDGDNKIREILRHRWGRRTRRDTIGGTETLRHRRGFR